MHPGFLLVQMMLAAVPLGGVVFFGWLGLRFVRARERDVAGRLEAASVDELARLQDTVVSLQSELQALRERQEFMERLLERPRPQ